MPRAASFWSTRRPDAECPCPTQATNLCGSNPTACPGGKILKEYVKPTAAVAGDASNDLNGALGIVFVAVASLESFRLVEGRKAAGLDTFLRR